nr:MAG TPA: Single strand binding protein [Caudoviricetes sp.]
MNKVILMGRLTRDPEIRYPQDPEAAAVGRFSLAVDRRFKKDETDFFNCVCFGRQAEFVEKYLKKGIKMLITGRVENNNYTDRDGHKVYAVQIMVEEMEFAESKAAGQSNNEPTPAPGVGDGFMNIPDGIEEELPFA